MVLANTSVHVVEQAPQNGCYQNLCPQDDSSCLHVSLGDSPRSAGGSDPGSFQITASALAPWACEILCASFKKRDSCFLQPSECPECKPHWSSKSSILGIHLPGAGPLGNGEPSVVLGPLTPWRKPLQSSSFSHLWVSSSGNEYRLYCISAPPLRILLWFLYNFNCKLSFLLDSSLSHITENMRLTSFTAALWIVVILVCPWEEVNSGSSSSTILANESFYLTKSTSILHCKSLWSWHSDLNMV